MLAKTPHFRPNVIKALTACRCKIISYTSIFSHCLTQLFHAAVTEVAVCQTKHEMMLRLASNLRMFSLYVSQTVTTTFDFCLTGHFSRVLLIYRSDAPTINQSKSISQSINQSIKTYVYSAMCSKRIRH